MPMSNPLWTLEKVCVRGRAKAATPRLHNVSVTIGPGVTAVIGHSGAGKTSLLNLLVDFERADSGNVMATLPSMPRRLPLFWVPQNDGLWPHLTAEEHLRTVISALESRSAIDDILDAFDLGPTRHARPDSLSQGERSRLSAARAMASGAAVLVMDEPLVHVDPARAGKYWESFRRLCAERQTALVFATHSPETVLGEAARAICLHAGHVVYDGLVEDLYYWPPTAETAAFLGPVNWLPQPEAERWLSQESPRGKKQAGCFRPEQVQIIPAAESPLIVRSSRFLGSVAEVEIIDERNDEQRRFYHRPAANTLRAGERVLLAVVRLVLLMVLFCGCGTAVEPQLAVRDIRNWSIPPEGRTAPAPRSVAWGPGGELYALDTAGRVLVFDDQGTLLRQWKMPEYDVGRPEGICVFKDGRIVVTDTHYHRVVVFDRNGKVLELRGSQGTRPGQFIYPVAITQDAGGNYYVGEYGSNDRIQKFQSDGTFLVQFGGFGTAPGQFQRPSGIAWHQGKLYVADAINNRIQVFSDDGRFLEICVPREGAGLLHYPYDLKKTKDGDLLVVEYGAGRISRFDLTGKLLGRFGSTGRGHGEFSTPWGLTVDAAGRVVVADTGNRRIVELRL